MNVQEKERIIELRCKGITISDISNELGVSVNAVKSYLKRQKIKICNMVENEPVEHIEPVDNIDHIAENTKEPEEVKEPEVMKEPEVLKEHKYGKGYCKQCGKLLKQDLKTKEKIFCSDDCRHKWWTNHSELLNKKAFYEFECKHCHKKFTAYGNTKRKYCSHDCYVKDRMERLKASVEA